jgi:gliding motility-associated lipoprotein GldH
MKSNIFFLLSFIFLVSCNPNRVYHQFDKNFTSNRWKESDVKEHNFKIEAEGKYDIIIEFSHIHDYDLSTIPLTIKVKKPDGSESTEIINLPIKDESGKQLADCTGDICDLYYTYKRNQELVVGEYSITIANISKYGFLPNVIGVGLTVDKSQ